MPATTTLLGLVTPTQGTLSGTWGDTVNYELTMVGKEKVTSGKATLLATIKYKCPEGERVVQYPRHANLSFEMK